MPKSTNKSTKRPSKPVAKPIKAVVPRGKNAAATAAKKKPQAKPAVRTPTRIAKTVQRFAQGTKADQQFHPVTAQIALQSMQLLRQRYPDADCELTYKNDFQLLISVILSAQTTDVNVNRVTPNLFRRFPTAKALAQAPLDEIKDLIRSTGFFNNKATNIQACAQALVTRFGGLVPANIDDLTTLPGVGRKTANVVLGVVHGIPGWTVDTHVQRLSKRLGFSGESDPGKIEKELQILFPQQDWTKDSITLIWHGRRCCYARKPDCAACPVNHLCPSAQL